MVDQRVPVPLALEDRGVAVPLVLAGLLVPVPLEEHRERFLRVLAEPGVAKREVERRPGGGPFPAPGLEAAHLALAAFLAHDLEVVGEIGVRRARAEVVALLLAREQVVQVAAPGLLVSEPRLGNGVLAVVGLVRLLVRRGRELRASLLDRRGLLDQLPGVVLLAGVEA